MKNLLIAVGVCWSLSLGCHGAAPEPTPDPTNDSRTARAGVVSEPETGIPVHNTREEFSSALAARFAADTSDGSDAELVRAFQETLARTTLRTDELACKRTICKLTTSAPDQNIHSAEFSRVIGPGSKLMRLIAGCRADAPQTTKTEFRMTVYCGRPGYPVE